MLPRTPEELLAEFTDINFNTFTLDELVGAFGNANFLANPTAYTFVLVCSCLNALTLVFASFKLHR